MLRHRKEEEYHAYPKLREEDNHTLLTGTYWSWCVTEPNSIARPTGEPSTLSPTKVCSQAAGGPHLRAEQDIMFFNLMTAQQAVQQTVVRVRVLHCITAEAFQGY